MVQILFRGCTQIKRNWNYNLLNFRSRKKEIQLSLQWFFCDFLAHTPTTPVASCFFLISLYVSYFPSPSPLQYFHAATGVKVYGWGLWFVVVTCCKRVVLVFQNFNLSCCITKRLLLGLFSCDENDFILFIQELIEAE